MRLFLKWMYHHQIYQILKNKEAHTADKENLGFISKSTSGFSQTLCSHSAAGSSQTLCSQTSLLSTFAKAKSFLGKKKLTSEILHQSM